MNSPEIKQFIHEHSNLFWYTPEDKKEEISTEFLVETILNYGDLMLQFNYSIYWALKRLQKAFSILFP